MLVGKEKQQGTENSLWGKPTFNFDLLNVGDVVIENSRMTSMSGFSKILHGGNTELRKTEEGAVLGISDKPANMGNLEWKKESKVRAIGL